jgi:hypothetical protein
MMHHAVSAWAVMEESVTKQVCKPQVVSMSVVMQMSAAWGMDEKSGKQKSC